MKVPTASKIFLCMAALLVPLAAHSQVLVGDFQFNNTLASSVADSGSTPTLINPGTGGSGSGGAGTFTTATINGNTLGALSMPAASGLSLNISGLLATGTLSTYTVAVLFLDTGSTSSGYQSLIDPTAGTKDNHTYIDTGKLDLFNGRTQYAGSIASNTWTQVIESVSLLTSGTMVIQSEVTTFGSGGTAVYNSFNDFDHLEAFQIAGNQINFFRDDNGDNFAAASVARLEIYNNALSQSQMASLDLTQETAIPEPQTWATLACGLGCLIIFRRRRS